MQFVAVTISCYSSEANSLFTVCEMLMTVGLAFYCLIRLFNNPFHILADRSSHLDNVRFRNDVILCRFLVKEMQNRWSDVCSLFRPTKITTDYSLAASCEEYGKVCCDFGKWFAEPGIASYQPNEGVHIEFFNIYTQLWIWNFVEFF